MITLFQIATLSNWAYVGNTQWFGCNRFHIPFFKEEEVLEVRLHHGGPKIQTYHCDESGHRRVLSFVFFVTFTVLTAWIILSLFIGVIAMGMFEAFEALQQEVNEVEHQKNVDESKRDDFVRKLTRKALDPKVRAVI